MPDPYTLSPGVYVDDLWMLGGGCTDGMYVCPRLDAVRRHYKPWNKKQTDEE